MNIRTRECEQLSYKGATRIIVCDGSTASLPQPVSRAYYNTVGHPVHVSPPPTDRLPTYVPLRSIAGDCLTRSQVAI